MLIDGYRSGRDASSLTVGSVLGILCDGDVSGVKVIRDVSVLTC